MDFDIEKSMRRRPTIKEPMNMVQIQKAMHVLIKAHDNFLPNEMQMHFRKHIENNLRVEVNGVTMIDFDRFMDHSLILFMRFNKLTDDRLSRLYYAWSLLSVDFIDFD